MTTLFKTLEAVLHKLLIDAPIVIDWFRCNELVVNPDKFQVMLLGCDSCCSNSFSIRIDDNDITSSTSVKLLGTY